MPARTSTTGATTRGQSGPGDVLSRRALNRAALERQMLLRLQRLSAEARPRAMTDRRKPNAPGRTTIRAASVSRRSLTLVG